MDNYPIIHLPGSDRWESAWTAGQTLEELFPGQDAWEFKAALTENPQDAKHLLDTEIRGLLLLQQGENEERDWVWLVRDGNDDHWVVAGGCDYTGWDCRSWVEVAEWPSAGWQHLLLDHVFGNRQG